MRYLVTQSLLSAWLYLFKAYDEAAAMDDFVATLRRERKESTEAMQNGIDFETACYAAGCGGATVIPDCTRPEPVFEIANIIRGGIAQVKATRPATVDGIDVMCHGVLDVLKAGTIYDIKFKNKSFGSLDMAGYYLDSPQHPMYFYLVPEAAEFRYLVSDGNDVYIESYSREETEDVRKIISDFFQYLKETNLWYVYEEHWRALS